MPQQVVQACHACIEIARLLSPDIVHPHLVILGTDSEFQLQHVAARLEALGIQYQPFYEPDLGSQLTSLATEPLSLQQRKAMQRYRCWGESALTKKDKNKRGRNMSSVSNTHRSRYGFHPCNFEVYRQLKYLHRRYWDTLRQFHTWHRWYRKQPENRSGSAPKYCAIFVEDRPWAKRVTRNGEKGFKRYPKTVVDHDVMQLYHEARMPQAQPVDLFSDQRIAAIKRLYEQIYDHFETEKLDK